MKQEKVQIAKFHHSAKVSDKEIVLPVLKKFQLLAELPTSSYLPLVDASPWDSNGSMRADLASDTQEEAILQFILEPNNSDSIVALFEAPHAIVFHLLEYRTAYITNSPFIISVQQISSGDKFKSKLSTDPKFKAAYDEVVREKTIKEREEKAETERRVKQKEFNFYQQWKWLESKRDEGTFDEFIEREKTGELFEFFAQKDEE